MNTISHIPERQPERQIGAAMLWWLGAFALLIVLAVAGAPLVIKWYLEGWLRDQNVVNVSIDDIDFNPFAGRFVIKSISYEEDGQQRRADFVSVDLAWADLAQRRIRLADVRLEGARLAVRRSESEGMFLGSIALGAARAAKSADDTQEESGWGFGIDRLELNDVLVDYKDPLVVQRVLFEELAIDGFATWAPERETGLRAVLSADEQRLAVDGELAPLAEPWSVDLRIRGEALQITRLGPFLIDGDDVSSDGALETDLRIEIEAAADLDSLQVSVTGTLGLLDLSLIAAGAATRAGSINWDGVVGFVMTGEEMNLTGDGTLLTRGIDVSAEEHGARAGLSALDWQGEINYATEPQSRQLSASGSLTTRELAVHLQSSSSADATPASLELATMELGLDALKLSSDADGLEAAWDGSLTLGPTGATLAPLHASLASAIWRGRSGLSSIEDGYRLKLDGSLNAGTLIFRDEQAPLLSSLEALDWTGSAGLELVADGAVDLAGQLVAGPLTARRQPDGPTLLELDGVTGLLESGGPSELVRFGSLRLDNLAAFELPGTEAGHVMKIAEIEIDGLTVGAARAAIGETRLSDARIWLERTEDGGMSLGPSAPASGDASIDEDAQVAQQTEAPSPFLVSLAGLATVDEARLDFVDRSVKPHVKLALEPLSLRVGTLDMERPDVVTDLRIDTRIGQFTTLTFDGHVQPLGPAFSLQGQGAIRSLDLVELDGYARRNTSHRIDSGTLLADVDVHLTDGRLNSLAELKIFNLDMVPLKVDEKDEFSQTLGVPLTTALNLLRDKEDNITLDVPLKGELDELEAGIGGALRIVLNKGIQAGIRTAATTYFAPLWPALAASKLLQAASALTFRAVEFPPGEDTLGAEQLTYLGRMGEILVDRPQLSMTVCGRAVAADLTLLYPGGEAAAISEDQTAALADLARRRQLAVKSQLVERGVEPSRVATCAPQAMPSDSGPPRAEFGV